jgi:hypothetical protein
VKASRALAGDRSSSSVGPIGVEVLEGLRRLRVWCEPNDWGLNFDLVFEGATPPFEEPHFLRRSGNRVVMDYTRLTQTGVWSGEVSIEGRRFDVTPEGWRGARDHSWGIRPVGDREPASAPVRDAARGFFWSWSPLQFDDFSLMYTVSENHDGSRWHEAAARVFPYAAQRPAELLSVVKHGLRLKRGTRLFDGGRIVLQGKEGGELTLDLEPLHLLHMSGAGYAYGGGDLWRHGQYRGELAVDGEAWDITKSDVVQRVAGQNQTVCRAQIDGQTGYGIFEFLLLGLYEPYGFHQLADVAQ